MKRISKPLGQPYVKKIALVVEAIVAVVLVILVIALLKSIGPQNMRAEYQYDGHERHETNIPFLTEKKSDFFEAELRFSLSTIHALRYVIGPDDCIETMTVNDVLIQEVQGLCDTRPGHVLVLDSLRPGENVIQLRVKDTGGDGGITFYVPWHDPLVLMLLSLLLIIFIAIYVRLLSVCITQKEHRILSLLVIAGFLIRLSFLWHGGFGGDIHLNKKWAESAATFGVAHSYSQQVDSKIMLPNYPPLSLMIFGLTGNIYKNFISLSFDQPMFNKVIKFPAIIADLLTIVLLFALLAPIKGKQWALVGAGLYAMHPAVIHNSSVWGQTDALFTLFLCLTIFCMQRSDWLIAGASFAAAFLIKMQSIILLPIICCVALFHSRRLSLGVVGGILVALPVFTPILIGGAIQKVFNVYLHSAGYYTGLTLNAFNFWTMLYTKDTGKESTDLFLNLISFRNFGLTVWAIIIASTLFFWGRAIHKDIQARGKNGMMLLSAAIIAYAFFLFNAEMHERYLFPYMALALPLIVTGTRGLWLYLSTSVLFTLNLASVVAFGSWDQWLIQDEWGSALPVAIGAAHLVVFILTWIHIHSYQRSLPTQQSLPKKYLQFLLSTIRRTVSVK